MFSFKHFNRKKTYKSFSQQTNNFQRTTPNKQHR